MINTRRGNLKFRFRPWTRRPWGGPFNGQRGRILAVSEIMLKVRPEAIIETGTYLGETTEWLSAFQVPIYSCEAVEENYGYAQSRLIHISNIKIAHGDSRSALKRVLAEDLADQKDKPLFFYLDAHWFADLPLADELQIVFAMCPMAIVMVDDFQTPGDSGYGFDDYGPGKALTPAYINDAIGKFDLVALYPTLPSAEETGARRGCVVLAKRTVAEGALADLRTLAVTR